MTRTIVVLTFLAGCGRDPLGMTERLPDASETPDMVQAPRADLETVSNPDLSCNPTGNPYDPARPFCGCIQRDMLGEGCNPVGNPPECDRSFCK